MVHISNQMRVTWGEEVPRGIVKNFHRHCELPAVCDSVNGVDGIISLGRSTRCQSPKNEEQYIVISVFKTYISPILVGLVEGKESDTSLMSNHTPKMWNDHYGVR